MQSRKSKVELNRPNLSEAAEKTELLIRGLQSRLLEGTGDIQETRADTAANLERQLQEYFEIWPGEDRPETNRLTQIRNRVVDGVVDRILRSWESARGGPATPFENEVIERLIDRVVEKLVSSKISLPPR